MGSTWWFITKVTDELHEALLSSVAFGIFFFK